MTIIWLMASAYAQNIGIIGQSNALGYADPYPCTLAPSDPTCDDVPAGAVYVRNGVVQSNYTDNYSGVEVGLIECLVTLGWSPNVYVEATNSAAIAAMMATNTPNLISDFNGAALIPDVLLYIHGEQDAKNWANSQNYEARLFGPAYDPGGSLGHTDPATTLWVQPFDKSVIGQLRAAFPGLPVVITELRTRDNIDLAGGSLGDVVSAGGAYTTPYHQIVRAAQHHGCASTAGCLLVETEKYATSAVSDLHYSSDGFYDLGWDLCTVVDQWAMQSF